jgi:hypothetical protein
VRGLVRRAARRRRRRRGASATDDNGDQTEERRLQRHHHSLRRPQRHQKQLDHRTPGHRHRLTFSEVVAPPVIDPKGSAARTHRVSPTPSLQGRVGLSRHRTERGLLGCGRALGGRGARTPTPPVAAKAAANACWPSWPTKPPTTSPSVTRDRQETVGAALRAPRAAHSSAHARARLERRRARPGEPAGATSLPPAASLRAAETGRQVSGGGHCRGGGGARPRRRRR